MSITSQQLLDLAYAADGCLSGIDQITKTIREVGYSARQGAISYQAAFEAVAAAAALYTPDTHAIGKIHSTIARCAARASHNAYNRRYRARKAGLLPENDLHEAAAPKTEAVASVRAQAAGPTIQRLPGSPDLAPDELIRLLKEESLDPKEAWEAEQAAGPSQAPDSITITRDASILRPEDVADGDLGLGQP